MLRILSLSVTLAVTLAAVSEAQQFVPASYYGYGYQNAYNNFRAYTGYTRREHAYMARQRAALMQRIYAEQALAAQYAPPVVYAEPQHNLSVTVPASLPVPQTQDQPQFIHYNGDAVRGTSFRVGDNMWSHSINGQSGTSIRAGNTWFHNIGGHNGTTTQIGNQVFTDMD